MVRLADEDAAALEAAAAERAARDRGRARAGGPRLPRQRPRLRSRQPRPRRLQSQAAPAEPAATEDAPAPEAAPAAAADPATEVAPVHRRRRGWPSRPPSRPQPPRAPTVSSAPSTRAASPRAATPKPAPAVRPKPAAATKKWVVKRASAPPAKAPEVEIEHGGEPTIWLNRAFADPTPASARLKRSFAGRDVEDTGEAARRRLGRGARGASRRRPPRLGPGERSRSSTASPSDSRAVRHGGARSRSQAAPTSQTRPLRWPTCTAGRAPGARDRAGGRRRGEAADEATPFEAEGVLIYQGGREDLERPAASTSVSSSCSAIWRSGTTG